MTFDLAIDGGTLVGPTSRKRATVYVRDGRIAAVTPAELPASEHVDATGLLVFPGMVDTHVHLMDPGQPEREDFPTGTAAAARAGVTTIIEHSHGNPVRTAGDLAEKRRYLEDRSRVDFALAAHAWPDQPEAVEEAWAAGAAFFKVFTCTTHGVPGFDASHLRRLFTQTAALDATCLVHAEDESMTRAAEVELRQAGRTDGGVIPEWRSRDAELTALAVVGLLALRTGARVVAAHASMAEAARIISGYAAAGASIWAETCPQYLSLRESEVLEHGAFRKFTPPARARSDADINEMWALLASGAFHHVSTDHAPSTVAQKQAGSIWDVHFGLPGIDTTLSVLLDGAARGAISYERVAAVYSEAPARTYGLFPRKGAIRVGADADVVLVDPTAAWQVRDEDVISKAAWSPLAGRTLVGRAVATILRGRTVAREGSVLAEPGFGRFLPGAGTRAAIG